LVDTPAPVKWEPARGTGFGPVQTSRKRCNDRRRPREGSRRDALFPPRGHYRRRCATGWHPLRLGRIFQRSTEKCEEDRTCKESSSLKLTDGTAATLNLCQYLREVHTSAKATVSI